MFSMSFSAAGMLQRGVALIALVAVASSMLVAVVSRTGVAGPLPRRVRPRWARHVTLISLLLCVGVGVIQAIVLAARVLLGSIALSRGVPSRPAAPLDFGPLGLLSLGALLASCLVVRAATSDRRLWAPCLWCGFLFVTWGCLLTPELLALPSGAYERTGNTLWVAAMWSVVLAISLIAEGQAVGEVCPGPTSSNPSEFLATRPHSPGFTPSVIVIATGLILLSAFHLAVPVKLGSVGYAAGAALVTASTGLGGVCCFWLLRRRWSRGIADVALGLSSLSLCSATTIILPADPGGLSRRYPILFSAMMIGLSLATLCWTGAAASLSDPRGGALRSPWSRLHPYAKRFAFLNASLALLLGLCLASWPRRPTVSATDDSLGRFAGGLAANLFLMLALLWCARRLRSVPFHVLTVLAVLSAAGFVVARMLPFTPRFG